MLAKCITFKTQLGFPLFLVQINPDTYGLSFLLFSKVWDSKEQSLSLCHITELIISWEWNTMAFSETQ